MNLAIKSEYFLSFENAITYNISKIYIKRFSDQNETKNDKLTTSKPYLLIQFTPETCGI